MVVLEKKHKIMVLEFLSEADAISAFTFNDKDIFKRIREHPLFINIEIHRNPNEKIIMVIYDSGLYEQCVARSVIVKQYKNYVRLIPEEPKYEWIAKEIVDLFINNKEYNILI
jgi:hypothetical protein